MNTSPRRACVICLFVLLVVSGSAAAVPTPREQPANTTPPVRVFVGETLDVSSVERTGGGTVGTGSVTLVGVAGAADGEVQMVDDPTDADFGDFATGTYAVSGDSDDRPEFVVTEPRVTEVVVENQNGANVTNSWEPTGERLTVTARYNFAEADRLKLTVRGPDGLDVTTAVASRDRITTDGGTVELDLSDEADGTFRIILRGSDLEDARRVVTVRTGPRQTTTPKETPTQTETPTDTPTATATEEPRTPTPTDTPTATETQPITPTPTEPPTQTRTPAESPTQTEISTPGFGLVGALLALALVVGYALRRR